MKYIRQHKKLSIITLIVLVGLLIVGLAYAKYFLNIINNYILETKKFYFNSSVLTVNNKHYQINNWDGVSSYPITVDLNNRKNAERYTTSDITYSIRVECDNTKLICTASKSSGIIYQNTHTDSYQITVTPRTNFSAGESVSVTTYVESSSPYVKQLSATYELNVVNSRFTYNIDDTAGDLILNLNLTNSMAYYEVEEAFGNYSAGDEITKDVYETLTDSQKDKCFSAKVTLTFDPNVVILDSTDESIKNRLSSPYQTTTISGNSYVSKYAFKVDAATNKKIIFYKTNRYANYTYPIKNPSSIVQVDVVLARE
ncbi:MAG: hypothetical protein IKE63_02065 [Bacilli bacterium]|nr:hypothetical protein [Bacilli bacterium]